MAAENCRSRDRPTAGAHASMRPRRMAAENFLGERLFPRAHWCFNEAAAHGRGKHRHVGDLRGHVRLLQ